MPEKIGQVNALSGTAVALSSSGESRILTVGSPVYKGDQIQSGPESALIVSLDNGQTFDMGRNLQLSVDTLLSNAQSAGVETITQPATVDVEAVQQAILEGLDPSELTSTAAGSGAEPSSEGGHEPVYVDYLAPEVIPESGFDTTGVNIDFLDPLVDTAIRGEGSTSEVVGDNNIAPPNDDEPTVPGDDDPTIPSDDDDPTVPGDDDDDPTIPGDDDDPTVPGDDPDIDIENGFPLAQSGVGFQAWIQNGNLNLFNALVSDHELGYGVSQNGNQPGRTEGLDNNESLLFGLTAPASLVMVTISAEDGSQVGGTLFAYDAERQEIAQLEFSDTGTYSLLDDAGEISYIVVNGDSPDNHDGFFVNIEAEASSSEAFETFSANSFIADDAVIDDVEGMNDDNEDADQIVVGAVSPDLTDDNGLETDMDFEPAFNETISNFDPDVGLDLGNLLYVNNNENVSDYLNIVENNGHLALSVLDSPGGKATHVFTLENVSFEDLGVGHYDPFVEQTQIIDTLLDEGVIFIDVD